MCTQNRIVFFSVYVDIVHGWRNKRWKTAYWALYARQVERRGPRDFREVRVTNAQYKELTKKNVRNARNENYRKS